MEYCVIGKGESANKMADKVVSSMLQECSRQLFGFTRVEFDRIVEYDILNIMAFYYSKMNAMQKAVILDVLQNEFKLTYLDDIIDNLALFVDEEIYVPLSCKLIERLGDSRVTIIVYETLFKYCANMTKKNWNEENSYSNYLALLNVAFFTALSYKLHVKKSCAASMQIYYEQESYEDLIEFMYEKHMDDLTWDSDVELDVLEELIDDSKRNNSFEKVSKEECMDAVERMTDIHREYAIGIYEEEDAEGFALIIQKTGIREQKCVDIQGFECHFCEAKLSDEEYIIVYQKDTHINKIIDKEQEWSNFQKELYYEDIRQNNSKAMVYIVYILDDNSDNIPIQIIESNKTYARKYVFTEEETITFINGIVKTSSDEIGIVSPVQKWDRILREEHLTGCLTEAYSAKKVENYLLGQRFDADYVYDDDYATMKHSKVPQVKWVKSLETTGFRDFCFDKKTMNFGQINLFYGANGSGKTSVLEAIEYALTAEVRRIKDFKVKLPTDKYPKLNIYDTEAGVHTFTPEFSKKNNKEIERVWYGVPVGRNKSNLNGNFNRFNAFDSEAAYKFIHESDNSEESFASMFGNLMFGETVVDHEKKWQRFKKAFNERYTELRSELSNARSMAAYYEQSLAMKSDNSKSDAIENGIKELKMHNRQRLPKTSSDRYKKILEELTIVRKYVELLSSQHMEEMTFGQIAEQVTEIKRNSLLYTRQKKAKSEEITEIAKEKGIIKQQIFDEREKQAHIKRLEDSINTDIQNWSIVQNVLSHEDTIKLVHDLTDELTHIEQEVYYISKIEQRTAIINFLKLDDYKGVSIIEKQRLEIELSKVKKIKLQLENKYNDAKRAFGKREQQTIELRKIGKIMLTDSKCPLCGHEYDNKQQLIEIIDNLVVVDDSMDFLITEIQDITKQIIQIERILERQKLIDKAIKELEDLKDVIPMVSICRKNYKRLYDYVTSKVEKEKRRSEIVEQQSALDAQGFSLRNITACKEYKFTDSSYLEYKRNGKGTYSEFLQNRLQRIQKELAISEFNIEKFECQIKQNNQKEELLKSEIHHLESKLEVLDIDSNREIEQALENLKIKFDLPKKVTLATWVSLYHLNFDKCEFEVKRLEAQTAISIEKQCLAEYRETIKRDEPMVERCARAVQAFEKMPSLSSFVEKGIRENIQQISKFFKFIHHSEDFQKLDIDDKGIYAIRSLNHQEVRTYEMSTGQRATIAMAVMFALHMVAQNAPKFLLLDEPLATMDDGQVSKVLDILKFMAEQNTQIFFTTANGIMINLFKECFKNTSFDYKEYQFIKRINRPSEIRETSVNDVKTIEELTLDELTLDFHQFAQIRNILRRNQEKLVPKEEWEDISKDKGEVITEGNDNVANNESATTFYLLLTREEQKILDILVINQPEDVSEFWKLVSSYADYKIILEQINEKALDFYGETIINTDGTLPYVEEDYLEELQLQHDIYYGDPNTSKLIEVENRLEKNLHEVEIARRQEEELRMKLENEYKKAEEEHKIQLEQERQKVEETRIKSKEVQHEEELRLQKEKELRKEEERVRIQLEEELRKTQDYCQEVEKHYKEEEKNRLELEEMLQRVEKEYQLQLEDISKKVEEEYRKEENLRKTEEKRSKQLEEELREIEAMRCQEEELRRKLEDKYKKAEKEYKIQLEQERQKVEEARIKSEEVQHEEELRLQKEKELQKEEKKVRIQLEEKLRKAQDKCQEIEKHYKEKEKNRLELEEMLQRMEKEYQLQLEDICKKAEEKYRKEENLRKAEEKRSNQLEEELREIKAMHCQEEELRKKLEDKYKIQLEQECQNSEKRRKKEEAYRLELEEKLRKVEKARRLQLEIFRKVEESRHQEELRKAEQTRLLQETEQQKQHYRQMNLCQNCGGSFVGLFNKKCKVCGKTKDY